MPTSSTTGPAAHVQDWRRRRAEMQRLSPIERFWVKVNKNGPIPAVAPELGPCWLWLGGMNNYSYGLASWGGGKRLLAHRISFELANGPIPAGLDLDHACRTPACIRPSHLQAVSHALNHQNRGPNRNSTTGVRGVYWVESVKKYRVRVVVNRKGHHGGYHPTLAQAEAAAIALRNELMVNNLLDRRAG